MDVSKLPKLSQTPKPPENDPPPQEPKDDRHLNYGTDRITIGGEAWISMIIGAVILFANQNFLFWLAGHADKVPTITDTATGAVIPYVKSYFFVRDLSLFAFGAALLLDGVLLLILRPWSILLGLTVTIIATLLNLYTAVRFHTGFGLQLVAILAVIFGLYTSLYQWKLLRLMAGKSAPMT